MSELGRGVHVPDGKADRHCCRIGGRDGGERVGARVLATAVELVGNAPAVGHSHDAAVHLAAQVGSLSQDKPFAELYARHVPRAFVWSILVIMTDIERDEYIDGRECLHQHLAAEASDLLHIAHRKEETKMLEPPTLGDASGYLYCGEAAESVVEVGSTKDVWHGGVALHRSMQKYCVAGTDAEFFGLLGNVVAV